MEDIDVLSPAKTGALVVTPSKYEDFWGVITGFTSAGAEVDEESGSFYRQIHMTITMDEGGDEIDERYSLPTDEKTGELKLNEDGKPLRPNATSKWGRQEGLFATLGVPWEGDTANLIGLHAHFVRKGVRITRADIAAGKRSPRGEFPYGRYIVEWRDYNNQIRQAKGLAPITATYDEIKAAAVAMDTPATPAPASLEEGLEAAATLAVGKNYLDALTTIRRDHKNLADFFTRETVMKMVADGLLTENPGADGVVVYGKGPALS